ncbi:hypothetical protein [Clostridium sp.]|uniref:hypothetical protein n=1 Tax=Clostridium sp. TaxID=1506 RepID=UPI002FCC050A
MVNLEISNKGAQPFSSSLSPKGTPYKTSSISSALSIRVNTITTPDDMQTFGVDTLLF